MAPKKKQPLSDPTEVPDKLELRQSDQDDIIDGRGAADLLEWAGSRAGTDDYFALPPVEEPPAKRPRQPTIDGNHEPATQGTPSATPTGLTTTTPASLTLTTQSNTTSGSGTARSAVTTVPSATTATPVRPSQVRIVPMCTAGDAAHDGDMEWTQMATAGAHTYLVGAKLADVAAFRNTHLAVVKLPADLRAVLRAQDEDGHPPGVGRTITLTGFDTATAKLPAGMDARLGNARVAVFHPSTKCSLTVDAPLTTLPTLVYPLCALARPKLRRVGNDFEPVPVPRGASMAGKPATYVLYPYEAHDRYGVRKLSCVVRGDFNSTDKWIPADLVLHLAKSTRQYNDTLAAQILDAANDDSLLAVTGKHLTPATNRAYPPCLFADGCTITYLALPDDSHKALATAARLAVPQRADAGDSRPSRTTPVSAAATAAAEAFTLEAATAAYTAAATDTAGSCPIADGHHDGVLLRLAACMDTVIDGAPVAPAALAFPDNKIVAAFISDPDVLQCVPPVADAGVCLKDMVGDVALSVASLLAAPERVSVAVKRHGALLCITHLVAKP